MYMLHRLEEILGEFIKEGLVPKMQKVKRCSEGMACGITELGNWALFSRMIYMLFVSGFVKRCRKAPNFYFTSFLFHVCIFLTIGNIPLAGVVVCLALALVAPAVRARAGADAVRAQAAKAWRSQSGGGPGRVHAQVWG